MISAEPLCSCLSVTLGDSCSWSGLSLGGWRTKLKCKTTVFAFSLIFYTWLSMTFPQFVMVRYEWQRENSAVPPGLYQILTKKTSILPKLFSSTGFSLPVEESEAAGQ